MKTYKLMLKIHRKTKLKYLCVTSKKSWRTYSGSGIYWKSHLKVHGKNIRTFLILESCSLEEISNLGLEISEKYNIVESDSWANLIPENGYNTNINIGQYGNFIFENKLGIFSDCYYSETKKAWCKLGGELGGKTTRKNCSGIFSPDYDRSFQSKKNYDNGIGLSSISYEDRIKNRSKGGLTSKETCSGFFGATPEQRKMWATENGKIGTKKVVENQLGFLSETPKQRIEWARNGGRSGGKVVGSFYWWNNGTINKKAKDCPREGWVRGQLESERKKKARELNFANITKK